MATNLVSSRAPTVVRVRKEIVDILSYANLNRNKGLLNDITLRIKNDEIYANRLILCCYSTFFEHLLREKRDRKTFDIEEIDAHSVATIIDYIYSGKIKINSETVMDLLETASKLQMEEVRQYCLEYLENTIDQETCFDVIHASKKYNLESLEKKAYSHITDNFDKINKCENFKELSKAELISCIESVNREKIDEKCVYEAIIIWIKHDSDQRMRHFPELFQLLKLNKLPLNFLTNVVSKEPIVTGNVASLNSVMTLMSDLLKENKCKQGGCKIVACGGYKTALMCSEVFHLYGDNLSSYPLLPHKVKNHSTVVSEGIIYLLGGEVFEGNNVTVSNELWQLKLKSSNPRWEPLPPMKEKRRGMGSTMYGDCLVVAGGGNGSRLVKLTEIYQKSAKKWKEAGPMKRFRSGNVTLACGSAIYAIGGADSNVPLSSVEKLSNKTGQWSDVAPMSVGRSWLAGVQHEGALYVFGGQCGKDLTTASKTGEKYDPAQNKWTPISDMNNCRSAHTACVLENKIYLVGGLDNIGNVVKEIECYDPPSNTWSTSGSVTCELFNHDVVVL